jgi:hypothetical protein
MATVSANEMSVEIKGALYGVESIDAGECGQSAVRVVKRVNGESYDLIRTNANVLECTCPDWVCRHDGKGTCCKHLSFAVAHGLLPVVVAAPAPRPAVSPVTPADVKRAAYFGLSIPKAPVVAAPVAVAELAPEIPATNPRDGWPAWVDADTWELGPDFVAEPLPVVSVEVIDLVRDARRLRREIQLSPVAGVRTIAPVALAADDESRGPLEGPRLTARHGFAPAVEDDAYASGFYLQFNHGLAANPPAEWRLMRSSAFRLGQVAGLLARHRREDEDHEQSQWLDRRAAERMAEAFGEPGDGWHDSERVRAVGVIEARKGGGR